MNPIDLINECAPIVSLAAPPLCGWIWWSARHAFATRQEAEALRDAVAELSAGLKSLEDSMPDGETMLGIRLSVQEMRGDLKATDAKLDGLRDSIDALNRNTAMLMQHHLEGE